MPQVRGSWFGVAGAPARSASTKSSSVPPVRSCSPVWGLLPVAPAVRSGSPDGRDEAAWSPSTVDSGGAGAHRRPPSPRTSITPSSSSPQGSDAGTYGVQRTHSTRHDRAAAPWSDVSSSQRQARGWEFDFVSGVSSSTASAGSPARGAQGHRSFWGLRVAEFSHHRRSGVLSDLMKCPDHQYGAPGPLLLPERCRGRSTHRRRQSRSRLPGGDAAAERPMPL